MAGGRRTHSRGNSGGGENQFLPLSGRLHSPHGRGEGEGTVVCRSFWRGVVCPRRGVKPHCRRAQRVVASSGRSQRHSVLQEGVGGCYLAFR